MKQLLLISLMAALCSAVLHAAPLSAWAQTVQNTLRTDKGKNLQAFFTPDFYEREMESWKYPLLNGFLRFDQAEVVTLDAKTILLHIPTSDRPYCSAYEEEYFDFIYRLYEIETDRGGYKIARMGGLHLLPHFASSRTKITIEPDNHRFLVSSENDIRLHGPWLIFKLAKEFAIDAITINGKQVPYRRLGYFILARPGLGSRLRLHVSGQLPVSSDNIQFLSLSPHCVFARLGGFAVMPSPPPGEDGRYWFSTDKTDFMLSLNVPEDFRLLHYGRTKAEQTTGAQKRTTLALTADWSDDLSFYAQSDWTPITKTAVGTRIHYYFPAHDHDRLQQLNADVSRLFEWCRSEYGVTIAWEPNFVVLSGFVKDAGFNDSHSIIAQTAAGLADDTYVHEILHKFPQPFTKRNQLWIKEGFTNFLSLNFLASRPDSRDLWRRQRQYIVHAFDLFADPLAAVTDTMPTRRLAYDKGPWVYRMLGGWLGEERFKQALSRFPSLKDTVCADANTYFALFANSAGFDLKRFATQWLEWRENPVLRVTSRVENDSASQKLIVSVRQEGRVFKIPLELEITTTHGCECKKVWLDKAEEVFTFPLTEPSATVRVDPDARIFAVIKSGATSFLPEADVRLPQTEQVLRYRSTTDRRTCEYEIHPKAQKLTLIRRLDGHEAVLELKPDLTPLRLIRDNALIYTMDAEKGQIMFGDAHYDTAEPVYPEEFVPLLLSLADWSRKDSAALLYLREDRRRCTEVCAKRTATTPSQTQLALEVVFKEATDVTIANGTLQGFSLSGIRYEAQ